MSALQLVRAAAGGDESAAATLYDENASLVRGMIARRVADAALVEDLCQEAWLRAFRALPGFRGDSAFSTWLHSIVRNVLISSSRRKTLVHYHSDLAEDAARSAADPTELRMDLQRALADLPDGMRQVLILHDVEGWTHQEIATTLGVAEGTSKSQLFKARAKLREALRDVPTAVRA
jgi:RNA polymerase sigma-70 factor, ECF subfamily